MTLRAAQKSVCLREGEPPLDDDLKEGRSSGVKGVGPEVSENGFKLCVCLELYDLGHITSPTWTSMPSFVRSVTEKDEPSPLKFYHVSL